MKLDKIARTEYRKVFLIDALPEPLTRASSHLQIFDHYLPNTRLRLRNIRVPETKAWSHILQQRQLIDGMGEIKISEIYLNEGEYAHFQPFEGNEIRKNRYFHEFNGSSWAFDVYLGPLWGLNTAIIELGSTEEADRFEPPSWAAFDITAVEKFDDHNLYDKEIRYLQDLLGSSDREIAIANSSLE